MCEMGLFCGFFVLGWFGFVWVFFGGGVLFGLVGVFFP